jgi:hypothetical protein
VIHTVTSFIFFLYTKIRPTPHSVVTVRYFRWNKAKLPQFNVHDSSQFCD